VRPDLVITDRSARSAEVTDVVRELRSRGSDVPVIVLSGDPNDEEEALKDGATDFICSADEPKVVEAQIRAVIELLMVHPRGSRKRKRRRVAAHAVRK
jgi:DNA-binding response OmpR family regulator